MLSILVVNTKTNISMLKFCFREALRFLSKIRLIFEIVQIKFSCINFDLKCRVCGNLNVDFALALGLFNFKDNDNDSNNDIDTNNIHSDRNVSKQLFWVL